MIKAKQPHLLNDKPRERYLQAFLIALGTAFAFFIPYIIADRGYFLFYGDFNVQQVPFYQQAHELVLNGTLWDYGTDLGANVIGSYSFYLLGSPFFWLTLLFPNWMVPYLMGPLLILKFACSSLTAYAYITRFVKNKNYALLGALLYAFSGFSVYNIFFNHFHEAIIFFPLLLLGMEKLVVDKKHGWFLVMVAVCAISNYFFFFGMVVFCVIYWVIRTVSGGWEAKLSNFGFIALEAVLGLLISAAILLPSAYVVLANSRVDSTVSGWNGLLYGKEQIYAYIIECFFFPPELPARPVFFTGADVKWSSVAGWMPVFSMTGVITWLIYKKKTWQRRLIIVMIIMAAIPVLNAAFYMFNYAYYARWFYMPILIMALVTAQSLEDETVDIRAGFRWTVAITLLITLAVGFFPTGSDSGDFWTDFGLFDKGYDYRFWIWVAIAVGSLIVLWLILKVKSVSQKAFVRAGISSVCAISVIYAAVFIGLGKSHSYETTQYIIPDLIEGSVSTPDKDEVRWDVYDGMDNVAMFLDVPSIQAFHSIVPKSVTDFYTYVGVDRGVASRPETDNYPLRSLLSVKYLLDYDGDSSDFMNEAGTSVMPCYTYYDTQGNYSIYTNDCYIPYGFTYDVYASEETGESFTEIRRQFLMLKGMLLTDKQIEKYGYLFDGEVAEVEKKRLADEAAEKKAQKEAEAAEAASKAALESDASGDGASEDSEGAFTDSPYYQDYIDDAEDDYNYDVTGLFTFSREEYTQDCKNRAASAAYETVFSNNSFTSKIKLEKDNLVFYSIPYEEGWSATVDGQAAEIEKVNVGFMAVLVPEGDHTVTFSYHTPYLNMGILITLCAVLLSAAYLLTVVLVRKRRAAAVPNDSYFDVLTPDALRDIGLVSEIPEPDASEQPEPPSSSLSKQELFERLFTQEEPEDEPAYPAAGGEPLPPKAVDAESGKTMTEKAPPEKTHTGIPRTFPEGNMGTAGHEPPSGFRLVIKEPPADSQEENQQGQDDPETPEN